MITVLAFIAFSFQSYGYLPVGGPVRSCDFLFCDAPERGRVRSLVSYVALGRGWRASALRLLDVVKLSVEVR
jgi:hypothetical protein